MHSWDPRIPAGQAQPYLCPACNGNRTRFEVVYHLAQQLTKDPATGQILYASDCLEPVVRHGRPVVEVRCLLCQFTGHEGLFVRAARRNAAPAPPPPAAGGC